MTFPTAQPAGYQTPWEKQRKLSVKNVTNEWIPGYACMYLDRDRNPDDPNDHIEQFYSQESERGHVVHLVNKPNAVCAAMQDPALLIINGPVPIPPYGNGWGTQDWPTQVLAPERVVRLVHLANGARAGPWDGLWCVVPGHAFTVLSHDATGAVWNPKTGAHTLWIAPNYWGKGTLAEGTITAGMVDYGEPYNLISVVSRKFPASDGSAEAVFGIAGSAGGARDGMGKETLEFLQGGSYWVSVSATLSSTTAPEGYSLKIALATRSPTDAAFRDTYLSGFRLQCIENDTYSGQADFYTAENVAFSGPLEVVQGEQIRLYNRATYEMTAQNVILSAFRLGAPVLSTVQGFQRFVSP